MSVRRATRTVADRAWPLPLRDRTSAAWFSAALLAVVLAPVRQNRRPAPRDGFPLSYYPMFTKKRRSRVSVTHLVGRDAEGGRRVLPYRHAGAGGMNQTRKLIRRTVERGDAEALCRRVARRLAADGPGDVRRVEVVTTTHTLRTYFAGRREPRGQVVHGGSDVPAPTAATPTWGADRTVDR